MLVFVLLGFILSCLTVSTPIQSSVSHNSQSEETESQDDIGESLLLLKSQGGFAFAGTVLVGGNGDTYHADHGYVQFQIPPNARQYPLILWHGAGLSGSQWERTPNGVYIIDQPRQGRAARASEGLPAIPDPTANESGMFNTFRLGTWAPPAQPQFFPGVQFPEDSESINQFFRLQTFHGVGGDRSDWSGTGDAYQLITSAVATLADNIGPAILVTHSGGANQGWGAAMKSNNSVNAIVAYEPTNFQFPEGELPLVTGPLQPSHCVPLEEFLSLTKIPIQIVHGDNLDQVSLFTQAFRDAQAFVDTINRHGGQAELLHLPKIGVTGNTHFAFSDLNYLEIADLLSEFLIQHHLD